MNNIRVRSHLRYEIEQPTSFAFSVAAARTSRQSVTHESLEVSPERPTARDADRPEPHDLVRLTVAEGALDLSYSATVTVAAESERPHRLEEVSFDEVPDDVLPYLNPSRYCESDRLGGFAHRHFGDASAGFGRVRAINDWVSENLIYEPGSTDGSSSATDVLLQRAGVCRDFAHVAITLSRAVGIPARYVSGYGVDVDPPDFHGFFEAYIGRDWYLFDPTGMVRANALVRIAHGRDAADTPFATLVGRAHLVEKTIDVTVDGELDGDSAAASTA